MRKARELDRMKRATVADIPDDAAKTGTCLLLTEW
jgi:hypothetical protein